MSLELLNIITSFYNKGYTWSSLTCTVSLGISTNVYNCFYVPRGFWVYPHSWSVHSIKYILCWYFHSPLLFRPTLWRYFSYFLFKSLGNLQVFLFLQSSQVGAQATPTCAQLVHVLPYLLQLKLGHDLFIIITLPFFYVYSIYSVFHVHLNLDQDSVSSL